MDILDNKSLVTPNLCVPLLLGLPFLMVNCIVIDFECRMAIEKTNGYDLLKPPICRHRKQVTNCKTAMAKTKKCKKLVLTELVSVCKQCLAEGKMVPEEVRPVNVAGLIRDHVEFLMFQQKVGDIEKQMLTKFEDVFQLLPHVQMMPKNVTARNKLKNAEETIKTWMYACPQKFWDVWKTLIQQHLDAGCIRPSSSLHASPVFIIPKVDASVLPRWVNNY